MFRRNTHLRPVFVVLLAVAIGVRGGLAGIAVALDGSEAGYIEVCTREGIKRVPADGVPAHEHGADAACHAFACSPQAHGGRGGGGWLPSLVGFVALQSISNPNAGFLLPSRLVPVLQARGPPFISILRVAQ